MERSECPWYAEYVWRSVGFVTFKSFYFYGLHATEILESLTIEERWVIFWKLNSQKIHVWQVATISKSVCSKTDTESRIRILSFGQSTFLNFILCLLIMFLIIIIIFLSSSFAFMYFRNPPNIFLAMVDVPK